MAIGNTEIVTGFQVQRLQPQAPHLPTMVAVCGQCGSLVHPDLVSVHAAWEAAAWSGTTMTVRPARGLHEPNQP